MKSSFTPSQIEQLNQLRARMNLSHREKLRNMLPELFSYNANANPQFTTVTDIVFSDQESVYAHPNQFEGLLDGAASSSTLTSWANLVADLEDNYGEMAYFDGVNTPAVFRTKVPREVVTKMVDLGIIAALRNAEFTFLSLDTAFYATYLLSDTFRERVDRVVGIRPPVAVKVEETVTLPLSAVVTSDPDLDRISASSASPNNKLPDLSTIIESAPTTTAPKVQNKMPSMESILSASSNLDDQIREAQEKLAALVSARNLERSLSDVKILKSALRLEAGATPAKVRGTLTVVTATGQQLVLEVSGAV